MKASWLLDKDTRMPIFKLEAENAGERMLLRVANESVKQGWTLCIVGGRSRMDDVEGGMYELDFSTCKVVS